MKKFTNQQRAIIAKKMGYDGPMQGFDQFLESSPALKAKYSAVTNKYVEKMAKGGMVKRKYAVGGAVKTDFTKAEQDVIFAEAQKRATASGKTPQQELYNYAQSQGYSNDQIDQSMGTYLKPGDTHAYINAQNNSKSTGLDTSGDVRTDFTKAEQDVIFAEAKRRSAASGYTPQQELYEYATSQGYSNDQIDQAMSTYLKPGDTQAYINVERATGLDTPPPNKLTLDDVDIDQVYRDALAYAKSGAGTVEDYIRGAGLRNNVEQSAIDSVVSKAPTYTSTPDSYTSTPDPRYLENRYNPADLVYLGGPGGLQQPTNNFSANEQAVRDMYGTIGRKGVGTGAYQIDQAGLNHFTKQLDLGLIAPDQLSTVFGQSVTDYIAANPDDKYSQYVSNYQNKPTGPGSMRPTDPPPLLQPRQVETPDYVGNMKPKLLANGGMTSGGIANLAQGGYPRRNGQIDGLGTGTSDSIPAMLSDGEFVMTAKAVQGAGGGSRRDGAKKMYALMHQLERNAARG